MAIKRRTSSKGTKSTAAKGGPAAKRRGGRPARQAGKAMLEKLRAYVRAHAEEYLADPNISSIGIGYKETDGTETRRLSIQFSVKNKVKPEEVGTQGSTLIPKSIDIGGTRVPTDVIERNYKPSYTTAAVQPKDDRRARLDVVPPGVSIGSVVTKAGTLGAFVRDRETKRVAILSNWHVLQGADGKLGDDVVQPGKFDDNRIERNYIGKLIRSHLGPAGDCAIASVSGRDISATILGLGCQVAKIGEPTLDDLVVKSGRTTGVTYGIVKRLDVNTKIEYPGGVEATIGGFEIKPDPNPKRRAPSNEITRPGDSGSAWMAVDRRGKPTEIMLGLHFAGDESGSTKTALACYATSVMNKLEVEPAGTIVPQAVSAEEAEDELRTGFDRNFLSFRIDAPRFTQARRDDLAALDGENEIRYCHFSVWLSRKRRYPLCVAWNIDGSKFKRLKRVSFRVDRRGDLEDYQLTNDIYKDNDLDRGHIARRADLCWGPPAEAKLGNYDSFYYTNIAPQHAAFNQSEDTSDDPDGGLWGRLENAILDAEAPHNLQISLMAGPVFSRQDRKFVQNDEECFLPREYWKVVAFRDDEDKKEKAFAFLLTQAHLVEGLAVPQGLDLDAWVWARITLQDLQQKTGVLFPKSLKDREVSFVKPQSIGGPAVKAIFDPAKYFAD